ncbi:MAG: LCCL domain-containing protein, partial [Planctomycetaceae bacterium]
MRHGAIRIGVILLSGLLLQVANPLFAQKASRFVSAAEFERITVYEVEPQFNVLMGSSVVHDDPGTLVEYRTRDNLGKSFDFHVTGSTAGPVWGSEIYTDDSHLGTVAVHAGLARPNETVVVRVTILPGKRDYRGEHCHGVDSTPYGPWPGSYMIELVTGMPREDDFPDAPENLVGIEGEVGESFVYRTTGSKQGRVWGVEVYTDDSSIAAAAVHAGVLEAGQTGLIRVTVLPGRTFYNGLQRHGVSSSSW